MSAEPDLSRQIGHINISCETITEFGPQVIWQIFTALQFCPVDSTTGYIRDSIEFAGYCPHFQHVDPGMVAMNYNLVFETDSERCVIDTIDDVEVFGERSRLVRVGFGHESMFDLPEWEPHK